MVIYLTGAPAAGKSTLIAQLTAEEHRLRVFEYGREMSRHLSHTKKVVPQATLRGGTSNVVTAADIESVNASMRICIEAHAATHDVIIDTHQVTLEPYGFRVAPFSPQGLSLVRPTEIWILAASPEAIRARISAKADGRLMPTAHQALMHGYLQESLALTYGALLGVEVHVFNADLPAQEVLENIRVRLGALRREHGIT